MENAVPSLSDTVARPFYDTLFGLGRQHNLPGSRKKLGGSRARGFIQCGLGSRYGRLLTVGMGSRYVPE